MQVVRSWSVLNSCIYLRNENPAIYFLLKRLTDSVVFNMKNGLNSKPQLNSKKLVIVSMDLPTSWQMVEMSGNDLTSCILRAVNAMLIDILATMARQDYETRRKRQAQGIERAKKAGLYMGKEKDMEARETVREMLAQNVKPAHIMKAADISRATF
ncbi:resolvase-like protein [Enterobacter sp. AG326]|nr:resolvase-like protein [Enterobacter sp. AG326]